MYSNLKRGLFLITLMGTISSQSIPVIAAENKNSSSTLIPEIGIEVLLNGISEDWTLEPDLTAEDKGEYSDMAFTNVTSFLYVRSEPTKESEYVGKLYPGAAMEITGEIGEWTPVCTGDVTGFVKTEYIIYGDEAEKTAEEMVANNEEFTYAESREQEEARLQEEAEAEAERMESLGEQVVSYACQFIGNPYVWGGTSLTNGADCSGFVQSVFANFGISLPRTSYEQRSVGTGVSYEEALPGDIICYDGHVGIYVGDGQIVNAQSPSQGIGISPATYTNILAVRRVL